MHKHINRRLDTQIDKLPLFTHIHTYIQIQISFIKTMYDAFNGLITQ